MESHAAKQQEEGLREPGIDQYDSPTIQNLIEQLDRDLKESERNATKAQ